MALQDKTSWPALSRTPPASPTRTVTIDGKEVEMALQDKTLLASIGEDAFCLAN